MVSSFSGDPEFEDDFSEAYGAEDGFGDEEKVDDADQELVDAMDLELAR